MLRALPLLLLAVILHGTLACVDAENPGSEMCHTCESPIIGPEPWWGTSVQPRPSMQIKPPGPSSR